MSRKLTPPAVASIYGVKPDTVLAWIRAGELRAIDVSSRRSSRPRFRIDEDDLREFEAKRAAVPPPKRTPRRKASPGTIQFF